MAKKYCYGAMAAFFSMVGFSAGQAEKTEGVGEIDMAARRESVDTLKQQMELRRERLIEISDEIGVLDARITKRLDKIVKILADTKDSQSSKTRVSLLKREAIEGLKRTIEAYASRRRDVAALAKTGDVGALEDLPAFDKRIQKLVAQVVELSKSFPPGQDVKKYESDGGSSYWNGYYHENSRISDEWRQNRRDASQAKVVRDETSKALRDTVARFEQRRGAIQDTLENRNPTAAERELYLQELGQIDAYEEKLKAELVSLTMSDGGSAVKTPSRDEVIGIERLFNDARRSLRDDISEMFQLYGTLMNGRKQLQGMEENLKARIAWLKENDPKGE